MYVTPDTDSYLHILGPKQAGKQAGKQADKKSGRKAERQASRQASRQAGKKAGRQASTRKAFSRSHALEGLVLYLSFGDKSSGCNFELSLSI